jgi:5-methylcytosine-specific restriction endonuclease McrA
MRWRKSDARKLTEERYRSKSETKHLAYLRKKKYESTENGKITKLNSDHRRRMEKKSGKVTAKEWAEKLKEFNYCCVNCGTDENIQMDHIYPLSKGGKHHIDNIQPLCGSCNSSKGAKIEWEG